MEALFTTSPVYTNLWPIMHVHTHLGVDRLPLRSTLHCTLEDTGSSLLQNVLHSSRKGSQQEGVWLFH